MFVVVRCLSCLVVLAVTATPQLFAQHVHQATDARKHVEERAPVLEGIGNLHHKVSTQNKLAQRMFDQGLTMIYGFNHLEAERSFRYAAKTDPKLAIAWWGVALALGSNINDPITPDREVNAYKAIQKAKSLRKYASPSERAYIDALATRYSPAKRKDRANLDQAYAAAMARVAKRYPNDPDAQTLYADALMNTMPWDYYEANGKPKPATTRVTATLEATMKKWPDHPGAHHLYIHAVEASHTPDRALPSARKLDVLVPGAGHLVHMPAHIYMRVGDYEAATRANELASKTDEAYLTQCRRQGIYPIAYYPHNLHFLTFALMMEGRADDAIAAAKNTARQIPEDMRKSLPNFIAMFDVVPLYAQLRFGRWDEILATPEPPPDNGYSRGVWHYARGLAFVRQNRAADAETHVKALTELAADPKLKSYKVGNSPATTLLDIAHDSLRGEMASAQADWQQAIAHFQTAVKKQDALRYNEPEDWYYPIRHSLGAVLLKAKRPADAEAVYRDDLRRNRENGWALFGLEQSLRAQGKNPEADEVAQRFQKAWRRADVKLTSTVF